jgi:hypothetical protein
MISRVLASKICGAAMKLGQRRAGAARFFSEASTYDNIKINHWSQLNTFHYGDLMNAIAFASNSERMADIIQTAAPMMTDQLLALSLRMMEEYEFDLGHGFYTKMLPFIKTYTRQFTRNHTQTFAETLVSMGNLQVKDVEYWAICKDKLVKDGYHRYIPLQYLGPLIRALANVGQADAELLKLLGSQVIKHQKAMDSDNINAAIHGFESAGISADAFRKALEQGSQDAHRRAPALH